MKYSEYTYKFNDNVQCYFSTVFYVLIVRQCKDLFENRCTYIAGKPEKIKFDFWTVIYLDKPTINHLNEGS